MGKYSLEGKPALRLLSDEQIKLIHEQALHVLETTGIKFESEEALQILKDSGAPVDFGRKIAKISPQMAELKIGSLPQGP